MAGNKPTPKSPFVKSFTCRNCGAAVTIQNVRDSIVVFCGSCQSAIDLTDPNYQILSIVHTKTAFTPTIPLGSRGTLQGSLWEVIGFMRRKEIGAEFYWDEYLLFNPYQGYRWLTESKHHWNFVTMVKDHPQAAPGVNLQQKRSCRYHDKQFQLFYTGKAKVVAVLGEFYWRVRLDDAVDIEDYISPPLMLSVERDKSEQVWSLSEYLEPEAIQSAFKLKHALRTPIGVAPNQPSKPAQEWARVQGHAAILFGLLIFFQIVHVGLSPNQTVFEYSGHYGGQSKTVVTDSFDMKHGLNDLSIMLYAPVQETWLNVDGDIVNEKTGETVPFNETVEYYHGYDDGESWHEGNNHVTDLFSMLPEGKYHLEYNLSAARMSDKTYYVHEAPDMGYNLILKRGLPIWGNFWWTLILLAIYPVWCWFRKQNFEVSRWMDSEYGSSEN